MEPKPERTRKRREKEKGFVGRRKERNPNSPRKRRGQLHPPGIKLQILTRDPLGHLGERYPPHEKKPESALFPPL